MLYRERGHLVRIVLIPVCGQDVRAPGVDLRR